MTYLHYKLHPSGYYQIYHGTIVFANAYIVQEGFGTDTIKEGEYIINADKGAFTMKYKSPNRSFKTIQEVIEEINKHIQYEIQSLS